LGFFADINATKLVIAPQPLGDHDILRRNSGMLRSAGSQSATGSTVVGFTTTLMLGVNGDENFHTVRADDLAPFRLGESAVGCDLGLFQLGEVHLQGGAVGGLNALEAASCRDRRGR
jgi:hypothetical protein